MDMRELCSQCNICHFMPEQTGPRLWRWQMGEVSEETTPVLVIDDAVSNEVRIIGCGMAEYLLGEVPFQYTSTVRCSYSIHDEDGLPIEQALASCSVWTRHLLSGRKLILATVRGLKQIGIEDKAAGDMLRSPYGLVLGIPALGNLSLLPGKADTYRSHTRRMLKEAGL